MPAVRCVDVCKTYRQGDLAVKGLDHVSLEIEEGGFVCLSAPSGGGKTTLLGTIMGFPRYRVTGGRIHFGGEDITDLPTDARARLGIGMSFQRPPAVRGVRTRDIIEVTAEQNEEEKAKYKGIIDLLIFLRAKVTECLDGQGLERGLPAWPVAMRLFIETALGAPPHLAQPGALRPAPGQAREPGAHRRATSETKLKPWNHGTTR